MSRDTIAYDTRFWHNIQPPESMDITRRFEYDEDAIALLKKWLRIAEGATKTIVEVGCGSAFSTGLLTRLAPNCRIVAVEPDDVLREYADQKFTGKVDFLRGKAEKIPCSLTFRI